MTTVILDLDEDTMNALSEICDQIHVPDDLTVNESIELAITALVESYDTTVTKELNNVEKYLSMQDAVEELMNPNISTGFTQPRDTKPTCITRLTYADIFAKHGTKDKEVTDIVMRNAIEVVMNELPENEWDTKEAEIMIEKTFQLLSHQIKNGPKKIA